MRAYSRPLVMGIINRTPDSFYDRGETFDPTDALKKVDKLIADGADIIDIGGVKAGPGDNVDVEEEIRRVIPTISAVHQRYPQVLLSVDTWRPAVAEAAVRAGARLINDTWAGFEPELPRTAGALGAGYVCSHTGGATPRTRPHRVHYEDVVKDVIEETTALAEKAIAAGAPPELVFIDPTHDFGKNTYHGLELLRRVPELVDTGYPVLMALSNKDFVAETTGRFEVSERLAGTLAATAWAAQHGVAAFRVHHVKETVDTLQMIAAIQGKVAPVHTIRGLA